MNWNVQRMDSCQSTMDEARELAAHGAPDRTVLFAKTMEDGRGQHGRGWHAPEGGLYASFVLRNVEPTYLTLALGNAVADVLEVTGLEGQLKWVNDVLVDGKKIAGILVESEYTGDQLDVVVAGIGLNVSGHAADWPHPLNGTATTLEDVLGFEQCLEDVENALLEAVDAWLIRLQDGSRVVESWRQRDYLQGKKVGIDPEGDLCAKVVGIASGITDQGHLRVTTDDGEQVFAAGRVFL